MSYIPNQAYLSVGSEITQGKKVLAAAINAKGGSASATESFAELAEDIISLPNATIVSSEGLSGIGLPIKLLQWMLNSATSTVSNFTAINDSTIGSITVSEAFANNPTITSVKLDGVTGISASRIFRNCNALNNVQLNNLTTITGGSIFTKCLNLTALSLPNLEIINGSAFWQDYESDSAFEYFIFPKLKSLSGTYCFLRNPKLKSITFGSLITFGPSSFEGSDKPSLRNVTIGQDTDVNMSLGSWSASNVINEGQSGIDELNSNLYNNLLTKLYDHSQDGQTRTLRIGWLANVTAENIAYANAKGWTLTT